MKTIIDNNEKVTSNSKQIEILKKNFPNCFDKEGRFLAEKLNSIINDEVEISNESYELNWLGKKYARLLANQEVTTMLTEDIEHNSKPENINSKNVYLEGDNLEVLKHMVNSYNNQIKMIYIDPPYNTGTDFIYKDDRKFTVEELSNLANIDEEEAKRILEFTESNSNSHSAWLTFMYPRLYVARELLKDDGVIFISIDDNENYQLKLLCDDIFGESNFITSFPRVTKKGGKSGNDIIKNHDSLLCYSKTSVGVLKKQIYSNDSYNLIDEYVETRGKYKLNQTLDYGSIQYSASLDYEIIHDNISYIPGNVTLEEQDKRRERNPKTDFCWRWSREKFDFGLANGFIVFKKGINGPRIYTKTYEKASIEKKSDYYIKLEERRLAVNTLEFLDNKYSNDNAKKNIVSLLNKPLFDYSKPVELLTKIIALTTEKEDIILDFFSGSGTTAHAVLQYNVMTNSRKKFILIQLAEKINSNHLGYDFCTEELDAEAIIPTIAKERIKRASKLIKEENSDKEYIGKIDFGFKVFKTKSFIDTNYFSNLDSFDGNQTKLLITNNLSHEELADLLLTWKLHDGIEFTKQFNELMLDDYIVYYVEDKAYLMYKDFTNRNIIQLLEELDDTESDFAVRNLVVFATNFTSKEQRELVEAVKGYKNKKKIELNIELRY